MGPDIFISSCSRRQLARRRHPSGVLRVELLLLLLVVASGLGAFVAARGGL
jgi:hypothetical protein